MKKPNLTNYAELYQDFDWQNERNQLTGLPSGKGLNIAHEAVDRHAAGHLENTVALRFIRKDQKIFDYSYCALKTLTSKFANVLYGLRFKRGDRVFALLGRVPELYIAGLGAMKFKAVFCPLISDLKPEPIFQRLSKGGAKVLVTNTSFYEKKIKKLLDRLPGLDFILLTDSADHLDNKVLSFSKLIERASEEFTIPPTDPEDPALLHFTSGTTGMPKAALHVHQSVLTHYTTGKYVLDFQEGDVFWCTEDPGWVTGTSYGIIAPLVNGVTSIIDEAEFDGERWYSILEKQKINVWYTTPTAIRNLMKMEVLPKEKYDLSNLRLVLSVGEPLHPRAVNWGEKAFGVPILDNWCQTETGGIMISNYRLVEVKPGSMGKPLPGIITAIAEVDGEKIKIYDQPEIQGHLVLKRGFPSLFKGYLHEEERYQKCFNGDWYISGDLAKMDKDGYFWFIGRADDIIKTSDHIVGSYEVESTLMKHPAVVEAAVIGKPEPTIGELVKAFVVLKEGFEMTEELKMELIDFAKKTIGPEVAPKEISFIEHLPKTKSGKILRRLLKARELGLPEGDVSTLDKSHTYRHEEKV